MQRVEVDSSEEWSTFQQRVEMAGELGEGLIAGMQAAMEVLHTTWTPSLYPEKVSLFKERVWAYYQVFFPEELEEERGFGLGGMWAEFEWTRNFEWLRTMMERIRDQFKFPKAMGDWLLTRPKKEVLAKLGVPETMPGLRFLESYRALRVVPRTEQHYYRVDGVAETAGRLITLVDPRDGSRVKLASTEGLKDLERVFAVGGWVPKVALEQDAAPEKKAEPPVPMVVFDVDGRLLSWDGPEEEVAAQVETLHELSKRTVGISLWSTHPAWDVNRIADAWEKRAGVRIWPRWHADHWPFVSWRDGKALIERHKGDVRKLIARAWEVMATEDMAGTVLNYLELAYREGWVDEARSLVLAAIWEQDKGLSVQQRQSMLKNGWLVSDNDKLVGPSLWWGQHFLRVHEPKDVGMLVDLIG